jgi:hypothetical protein
MTSQPYQPATDPPAISEDEADWRATDSDSPLPAGNQDLIPLPAEDPDLVVIPEGTAPSFEDAADPEDGVTGPVETGTGVEADGDDDGPDDYRAANPGTANPGTAASSTEDDLTAEDRLTGANQASDVSDDYPPASEPSVVAAQGDDLDGAAATAAQVTASPPTASSVAEDAASSSPLAPDVRPADLGEQWHDIQAMFVDDPRGSVQRAAAAADAAVSALAELLGERHAALSAAGGESADTEQLRETLRGYRMFCQNLADVGWQLQQPRP